MDCNDALGLIPDLVEWADQYQAEIEKQCSARASQIESLLIAGDYDAIREWLDQWEAEDKAPDSLCNRYREVHSELRKERSASANNSSMARYSTELRAKPAPKV